MWKCAGALAVVMLCVGCGPLSEGEPVDAGSTPKYEQPVSCQVDANCPHTPLGDSLQLAPACISGTCGYHLGGVDG